MSFASTGVVKHRKVVMVIVMVIFVYRTIFGIVLIKRLVVIVIVKFCDACLLKVSYKYLSQSYGDLLCCFRART